MIRFDERVAIVTGAGKGLGRAYAIYLAARGARVMVNNRRRSPASRRAPTRSYRQCRQAGGQAIANYDSVEDPASGERIVQQALDTWGRLDVLVNNAGVDQRSTFHKVSVEQFRQIFDINFYGSVYVTHAAYARMRAAGRAHRRVDIGCRLIRAARPDRLRGVESGADRVMRTLAMEGKSHNVLTNAIAPYAATPMTARQGNVPEEFMTTMRPEFVAPAVALMVSEQTSLNGQVIIGGRGVFRRAANVEGHGLRYAEPTDATPETLARDIEQLLDMHGATEFADAMAAFQQLFGQSSGAK